MASHFRSIDRQLTFIYDSRPQNFLTCV